MVEAAALVEQLDDMLSVAGLDDLRYLPRLHVLEGVGERRFQSVELGGIHLAAAHHRPGILRIHACQVLEFRLAGNDPFAHVEQALARALLGLRDRLGETGDLGVDILFGHGRQAVLVDRLVETLDLAGNDRHLAHDLALHGRGIRLLLIALAHVLANAENGHVVLGLEFGDRPLGFDHVLNLLFHMRGDVARIDLHRVDLRLVEEQFLGHQCLERLVHRVTVGGISFGTALGRELPGILRHFGMEDGRRPYDGDHLVEHHLLFLRERPGPSNEQGESRPQHTFFQHYSFSLSFVFSFSKIFMLPPSHARL